MGDLIFYLIPTDIVLQYFDTIAWVLGRASGL